MFKFGWIVTVSVCMIANVQSLPICGITANLVSKIISNSSEQIDVSGWSINVPGGSERGLFQKDVTLDSTGTKLNALRSGLYFISVTLKIEHSTDELMSVQLLKLTETKESVVVSIPIDIAGSIPLDVYVNAIVPLTSINQVAVRIIRQNVGLSEIYKTSRMEMIYLTSYPSAPFFYLGLKDDVSVSGTNKLQTLDPWVAKNENHHAAYTGFKEKDKIFESPCDGIYVIVASLTVKSHVTLSSFVYIQLLINGTHISHGTTELIGQGKTTQLWLKQSLFLIRGSKLELRLVLFSGAVVISEVSYFGAFMLQRKSSNALGFKAFKGSEQVVVSTSGDYTPLKWQDQDSEPLSYRIPTTLALVGSASFGTPVQSLYYVQCVVHVSTDTAQTPAIAILLKGTVVTVKQVQHLTNANSTVILSVFVDAGQGESLSIGIGGCVNPCIITPESSFSVTQKTAMYPGGLANLGVDMSQLNSGWSEVNNWKSNGASGLYDLTDSQDGITIAIKTSGIYILGCSLIVSDVESDIELNIVINGNIDLENGFYAKDGNPTQTTTLAAGGARYLAAGQTVSVYVYTGVDTDWYIDKRSGFSVTCAGKSAMGFQARLQSTTAVRTSGENMLANWALLWRSRDKFNSADGEMTLTRAGIYYTCANIVLENADLSVTTAMVTVSLYMNGQQIEYLSSHRSTANVNEPTSNRFYTLSFCGSVKGNKNDKLRLGVSSQADAMYNILSESSWSVVFIASNQNAAGFSSHLQLNQFFPDGKAGQFNTIGAWKTNPSAAGAFNVPAVGINFDNGIEAVIGSTGIYLVAANILLTYTQSSTVFSLALFINDEFHLNGISYATNQKFASYSLHVASSVFLIRGDRISIKITGSTDFAGAKIDQSSGWSVVRINTADSYPLASLTSDTSATLGREFQPHRDYATTSFPLAYIDSSDVDQRTGRYAVHIDGGYIITGNIFINPNETTHDVKAAIVRYSAGVRTELATGMQSENGAISFQLHTVLEADDQISLECRSMTSDNSTLETVSNVWFAIAYAPRFLFNDKSFLRTSEDRVYDMRSEISSWVDESGSYVGLATFVSGRDGIYVIALNIIVKGITGNVNLTLEINGEIIAASKYACVVQTCDVTLSLSNLFYLRSGQLISLFISSNESVTVGTDSTRIINYVTESLSDIPMSTKWAQSEIITFEGNKEVALKKWQNLNVTNLPSNGSLDLIYEDGKLVTYRDGAHFVTMQLIFSMADRFNDTLNITVCLAMNANIDSDQRICSTSNYETSKDWNTISLKGSILLGRWSKIGVVMTTDRDVQLEINDGSTFSAMFLDSLSTPDCIDIGPLIKRDIDPVLIQTAIVGQPITWICDAMADDAVEYNWYQNGKELPQTSPSLSIASSFQANGEYTCVAKVNGVTSVSNAVTLATFDVDECFYGNNTCNGNATCTNTQGSFLCSCNRGFSGNGFECNEIDECLSSVSNNCAESALCINTVGSFDCKCPVGYIGDGRNFCNDFNECLDYDNPVVCHKDGQCVNQIGSYTCECNNGYTGNGTYCEDLDECETQTDLCDINAHCENNNGSHTCTCREGFSGTGLVCTDLDECGMIENGTMTVDPLLACHENAGCVNTIGGHYCACSVGYTGSGLQCEDINECDALPIASRCAVNADCVNNMGSYQCQCRLGLTGDGSNCYDINECVDVEGACDAIANCSNTYGSYECACPFGYLLSGKTCNRASTGELADDCKIDKKSMKCMCLDATGDSDNILCNGLFVAIIILAFIAVIVVIFAVKYAQAKKNRKIKPVRTTRDKYIEMEDESSV